ncbi:MAG: hypothetical protein HOP25_04015 [Methylotenera sp.]|nr:hypothetical protein [Methylotenera sp.]
MVIRYSHDFKASLWALVTLSRFKPIYILASGDNNLSINFTGSAPAAPAATMTGDFKKAIDTHGTADTSDDTYIMSTDGSNNYTADPNAPDGEANALDLIDGTAGDDVIDGGGVLQGGNYFMANDNEWRVAA